MSASLCLKSRTPRFLMAGFALMALAACEHYAPNTRPDPNSTEAITRAQAERMQARGASRVMAPSQLRIATGGFTQGEEAVVCRDWLDPCWEKGGAAEPATTGGSGAPALPGAERPAAAQTFRGVLPCTEEAMNCTGQHATLTLFANQTWRGRLAYIDTSGGVGKPTQLQGCWRRVDASGRHFLLTRDNGSHMGAFEATSNNTLVVRAPGGNDNLRYTLRRQPTAELLDGGAPDPSICRG